MNTDHRSYLSYEKPRNLIREEKLKQSQAYKKKNQQHPAFRK